MKDEYNDSTYLTLLSEKLVPCFHKKDALSTVAFIQDGITSPFATLMEEFQIKTLGKNKIINKKCRLSQPPESPNLKPTTSYYRVVLKSQVYQFGSCNIFVRIERRVQSRNDFNPTDRFLVELFYRLL